MKRKLYIRYKEIPFNNKSGIYKIDEKIGEENGVSVWNAKYKRSRWFPVLPKRITEFTFDDFSWMMQCCSTVLLVSGKEIGKGSDGEPIIKNIKVKKQLKRYSIEEFDAIVPSLYRFYKMTDILGKEIVSYDEALYLREKGFDGVCTGYYHTDECYKCDDCRYEFARDAGYRNSYSYSRAAAPTIRAAKLWYTKNKIKPYKA